MDRPATGRKELPRDAAVLGLIGRTPTVRLRFEPEGIAIHAKCEFLNLS